MTLSFKASTARSRRIPLNEIARIVVVSVVALVLIVAPLYLLLINAAKDYTEARNPSFAIPTRWALFHNLAVVFREGDAVRGFLNSVVIATTSVAIVLLLGAMAAWRFARSSKRWVRGLFYYAILGLLVPPPIVTSVLLDRKLGIAGRRIADIGTLSGVYLALAVFILTGFIRTIPRELEEAFQIDGASRWQTFWRLIFPLLGSALFSIGIILIVYIWNDFFYAFFLLSGNGTNTLPLGLFAVVSSNSHDTNWNYVFANVIVVSLPLLVVFFIGQRRILSGVMAGSLK